MGASRRFLAPGAASGSTVQLDLSESHHLLRVLRLVPGAVVEIFDGAGQAFAARFQGIDGEGLCLLQRQGTLPPREPAICLAVGLAIPKGDGFTEVARQLAEIGVMSITPILTEFSEGSAAPSRLSRWRAAALSGARQCGRALVPSVLPPIPFAMWLRDALAANRWIASPHPRAEGRAEPAPPAASRDRVLAIGPEGGFSQEELDDAYRLGFRRLDLGERVLRTSTASIVAAAALLAPAGKGRTSEIRRG